MSFGNLCMYPDCGLLHHCSTFLSNSGKQRKVVSGAADRLVRALCKLAAAGLAAGLAASPISNTNKAAAAATSAAHCSALQH